MRKIFSCLIFFLCITNSFSTFANPGNYTLRILLGPSFNTNDWTDQVKFGGAFNYDLGYALNIGLVSQIGVGGEKFKFNMIPSFGYDFLYVGPAAFHVAAGLGYGVYDKDSGLDVRFGSGLSLPLGDFWEAYSDIAYIFCPVGTPGTPATFDWMLGFGFVFQ